MLTFTDGDRMGFAYVAPLPGQDLGESIPVIGVEQARGQVFDLVVEPSEGCSITMADNPGDSLACNTTHHLDDPSFVFLSR